jgi:hypothetical protein
VDSFPALFLANGLPDQLMLQSEFPGPPKARQMSGSWEEELYRREKSGLELGRVSLQRLFLCLGSLSGDPFCRQRG